MTDLHAVLRDFDEIPTSRIGGHPGVCCPEARRLLHARFSGRSDVGAALAAIPEVIRWGPTRWPIHWCELVEGEESTGDCGVHADLASEMLTVFGVSHDRARIAVEPPALAVHHWRSAWTAASASTAWINDAVVHHEVLQIGERWWDPTSASWFAGLGARLPTGLVVAIRSDGGAWSCLARSANGRLKSPADGRTAHGRANGRPGLAGSVEPI